MSCLCVCDVMENEERARGCAYKRWMGGGRNGSVATAIPPTIAINRYLVSIRVLDFGLF